MIGRILVNGPREAHVRNSTRMIGIPTSLLEVAGTAVCTPQHRVRIKAKHIASIVFG